MESLIHFHKEPFKELSRYKGIDTTSVYWKFMKAINGSVLDRTRTLDIPLNYRIVSPIPKLSVVGDFASIVDDRAQEIIERNIPIILYWSGGIDSSVVLASLLRNGVDPKTMTIRLNQSSIVEDTEIYENIILDKIPVEFISPNVKTSLSNEDLENNIVITGESGDQLMGCFAVRLYAMPGRFNPCRSDSKYYIDRVNVPYGLHLVFDYPWYPVVKAFFYGFTEENYKDKESEANEIMEYISPLVDTCPFPVKNAFDAWWWLSFSCKWQGSYMKFVNHLELSKHQEDNFISFFITDEFQQWAMTENNHRNLKIVPGDDITTYKWTMKKYIEDCLSVDMSTKIKIPSLPGTDSSNMWFRTSMQKRTWHDKSSSPKAYDLKYGNQFDSIWKI